MRKRLVMAAALAAAGQLAATVAQNNQERAGPDAPPGETEEQREKRLRPGAPPVKPGQREIQDANFDNIASGKPITEMWLSVGKSIWNDKHQVDEVPGVAGFIHALDSELLRTGTDVPRYDIGQNARRAQANAIQAYAKGREALVLMGEGAAPVVDKVFPILQPLTRKQGEIAQTLLALAKQQQRGDPVPPAQFQALEAQAEKTLEGLKEPRRLAEQAYPFVDSAQSPIRAADGARFALTLAGDGTVAKAKELDDLALKGATRNAASGRETRDSVEGRSGPLLDSVARRIEAATQRTQLGYEWMKRMTDPRMGFIAVVAKLVQDSADLVKQTSQEAQRGNPNLAHAQEAQDLSLASILAEGKVEYGWGLIREKLLGLQTENDHVDRILPPPLPATEMRAQAPRRTDQLIDALNQTMAPRKDQKSAPIRYPDSLKNSTRTIMQREGLSDGNFQCPDGHC